MLTLCLSTGEVCEINMEAFLKRIIKDSGNPYLSILKQENFEKAYAEKQQLIWPSVLRTILCSGEIDKHDAVFTEKEILQYLESVSKQ